MLNFLNRDILLLLLVTFLFFTSFNLLLPTFPIYIASLGGTERMVGLLGGLFTFGAVLQRPYFARLTDTKGRKYVLLISSFFAATGPLLYLISDAFWWLTITRLYHAISLAGFVVAGQTMLADLAPEGKRGIIMGYYGMTTGLPAAIFPALGFYLIQRAGFSWLFLGGAIVCIPMFPAIAKISSSNKIAKELQNNKRVHKPLFKDSMMLIACTSLFLVTTIAGAINTFLPLFALEIDITNPGGYFTVFSLVFMSGGAIAGQLSDTLGRRVIILPSFLLISLGLSFLRQAEGYLLLIMAALLMGLGFASVVTVLLAYIVDKTAALDRSRALSHYNNAFDLGLSAGAMTLGAVAALSFSLLWSLLILFALAGFVISILFLHE